MPIRILNTATTDQMGYGIVSFFYVLAPEGMNTIVFGERREKNQDTTACSEDVSSRRFGVFFNEQ